MRYLDACTSSAFSVRLDYNLRFQHKTRTARLIMAVESVFTLGFGLAIPLRLGSPLGRSYVAQADIRYQQTCCL
jgi:hypothetical protein